MIRPASARARATDVPRAIPAITTHARAAAPAHTAARAAAAPGVLRWTPGSARARSTAGLAHRVQPATAVRLP